MGTATASTEIILAGTAEILGPGSIYEVRRNELRREYEPIIEASKKITVIDSQESAEQAVGFGRLLQNGTKAHEGFFKGIKQQIDDLKKPILADEKESLAPINTEKSRIALGLTVYREKVETERREAERIAREAAEAAAKVEREGQERLAREEVLARAVDLESSGDVEGAEAVLAEEIVVPETMVAPVVIQAAAPAKFTGSTGRTSYSAKVVDFKALVKAVAEGKAPIQALSPNEAFINSQARAFKEGFSMAGCSLERSTSTSFRG